MRRLGASLARARGDGATLMTVKRAPVLSVLALVAACATAKPPENPAELLEDCKPRPLGSPGCTVNGAVIPYDCSWDEGPNLCTCRKDAPTECLG